MHVVRTRSARFASPDRFASPRPSAGRIGLFLDSCTDVISDLPHNRGRMPNAVVSSWYRAASRPRQKTPILVQCREMHRSNSQHEGDIPLTSGSTPAPRRALRRDESDAEHHDSRVTYTATLHSGSVRRGLVVDPEHRPAFKEFCSRVRFVGRQLLAHSPAARHDVKRMLIDRHLATRASVLGTCPTLRRIGQTGEIAFRRASPRTPAMRTTKESPVRLMLWKRFREQRHWSFEIAKHLLTRKEYNAFHVLVECVNLDADGDLVVVAESTTALQRTIETVAGHCNRTGMAGLIQADIKPSHHNGRCSLYVHVHQLLLAPPTLSAEQVSFLVRLYWRDMWDHPLNDNPFGGPCRVTKIMAVENEAKLRNVNRYCYGLRGTDRRPLPKILFGPYKPLRYGSAQFEALLAFLAYDGLQVTRFGELRRGNNRRYKAVLAEMQLPESLASASAVGKSMHGTPEPAEEPPKPRVRTYVRRQPPAGEPTPARTVRQSPPARGVRAKSRR